MHMIRHPGATQARSKRNRTLRASLTALAAVPLVGLACAGGASDAGGPDLTPGSAEEALRAPGALVDAELRSRVGVVLDEIPGPERAAAARYYLEKPATFWVARAKRQLAHTTYRLTYRNFYYDDSEHRQMLALPPEEVWNVELQGKARRITTTDGHDAVEIGYVFHSTIVTDAASPGAAEPRLRRVGGVWKEPFNLPLDPEFLFQRTGYACVDEDGYPLGTAESENVAQMFDQECDVETADTGSCHYTELPTESCLDALANHVGRVDTNLRLERIPYTAARAKASRVGTFTHPDLPDLAVLADKLQNNWVEYRYIPSDSCAITEQCVGGSGWRRLLLFDASIKNTGAAPLSVGSTDESSPPRQHNMFEFSECHQHFHFRHYGDFSYGLAPGDKRAFCVESTDRYYNNEQTPLVHEFGCSNQGVAAGWGDTYIAGVECNWIDVTDIDIPKTGLTSNLRFQVNPDHFICEGTPVLDANGAPVYEPTTFVTESGAPVDRPVCDFAAGFESNNVGTKPVTLLAEGGLTTSACTRDQQGPLRDCGFHEQEEHVACTPGTTVHLTCTVDRGAAAQVLRVCDNSEQLGAIPCMYREALATGAVGSRATTLSFPCPEARDAGEPGGTYSFYVAPLLSTQALAHVSCRAH